MDLEIEITTASPEFDFKTISLADPQPLNGSAGFYFTQLSFGKNNKALYLQLPECLTKQGIINIKNGKYLDLMFERANNDELLRWIEQLEYTCQDIIDSKKDLWFQTELTRDDIETMMTQVSRLYQSGKYMLIRVFVESNKVGNKCNAYDENEIGFDLDVLEPNKSIIPLIMIDGVKFSSRSFEISLKIVQVMVMGQPSKRSSCLIKRQQNVMVDPAITIVAPAPAPAPATIIVAPAPAPATIIVASAPDPAPLVSIQPVINKLSNEIEEILIDYATIENDPISLKKPNEVYYELYKKAREKAKQCRLAAIDAYLEAKQIKTKYMLFTENETDDDDISEDEQNISNNDDDEP